MTLPGGEQVIVPFTSKFKSEPVDCSAGGSLELDTSIAVGVDDAVREFLPIRAPFRGRRLKRWQRRHNSTHAEIRCLGEQAMATPKGWRLLRKLRCGTHRITATVQAVLVVHHASA